MIAVRVLSRSLDIFPDSILLFLFFFNNLELITKLHLEFLIALFQFLVEHTFKSDPQSFKFSFLFLDDSFKFVMFFDFEFLVPFLCFLIFFSFQFLFY